jgi:hypothetical protein
MSRSSLRIGGVVRAAPLLVLGVWTAAAHAQAFPPAADAAELAPAFARLRASAALSADAPLAWRFSFAGDDARALEALSIELVHSGYRIVALRSSGRTSTLTVERTELHTPVTLARRNRELDSLARERGEAYVGADVAAPR